MSRGRTDIDRPSPCHVSSISGTTPISIGNYRVSLSRGRTYIDRPSSYLLSCHVCLSQGRTHIDRPFSYQFVFSLSRDRTHIDRSFSLPIRSVRRPGLCFSMTFRVTALSIHIHWHCTPHLHGFALILILLTLLPYAYCFIIALLGFPSHCTWHSPLSSQHIISVILLSTLHLAFSYSSHRAVSFRHILSCTPRWFDRYSSWTSIFKSFLEMS